MIPLQIHNCLPNVMYYGNFHQDLQFHLEFTAPTVFPCVPLLCHDSTSSKLQFTDLQHGYVLQTFTGISDPNKRVKR